jgi:hypothetical protein
MNGLRPTLSTVLFLFDIQNTLNINLGFLASKASVQPTLLVKHTVMRP